MEWHFWSRSINILTEEELADLCSFRKHKKKGAGCFE